MTANKATIGYVVPKGYEPYTAFRPYEEISIPVAPSAILQRGTPSIIPTIINYKALIETKRKMYEILTGESWNDKMKKENTYMIKPDHKVATESVEISMEELDLITSAFGLYIGEDSYCHTKKMYESGDIVMCCGTVTENHYMELMECLHIQENLSLSNIKYDSNMNAIVATEFIEPNQRLFL